MPASALHHSVLRPIFIIFRTECNDGICLNDETCRSFIRTSLKMNHLSVMNPNFLACGASISIQTILMIFLTCNHFMSNAIKEII